MLIILRTHRNKPGKQRQNDAKHGNVPRTACACHNHEPTDASKN